MRQALFTCLTLVLFLPAVAQAASARLDRALSAIQAGSFGATVHFLADDLLEGRGTGGRGYDIAARYVASQFAALGLEPAGSEGDHFQPVPLREADVIEEEVSFEIDRASGTEALEYDEEWMLRSDPGREVVDLDAEMVFAGFGVVAPEQAYDDYADLDVEGKVLVVMKGAPPTFPHNLRAFYSSRSWKRTEAARRGAIAVIEVYSPDDEARRPFRSIARQSRIPGMTWLEDGVPFDLPPSIRAWAYVSPDGAAKLLAGAPIGVDELLEAAAAGTPPRFPLPGRVRITGRQVLRDLASPNVAALLPGTDPQLRDEVVVFTAHLDHVGVGPEVDGDGIYNGAYDNASGTAALIEIARAFAALDPGPRRSILFLAVTAEEKGLLGSEYFVHHPTVPIDSMVANVNLDMFLMLFPVADVVGFGADHSTLGPALEQAAAEERFEVSPDRFPEETIFVRSDQFNFVKMGIPALFVVSGQQSHDPQIDGEAVVRDWMRRVYHSPADEPGQPMDLDSAVRFSRLNFRLGLAVADADERPAWNPGDFFGERFARP